MTRGAGSTDFCFQVFSYFFTFLVHLETFWLGALSSLWRIPRGDCVSVQGWDGAAGGPCGRWGALGAQRGGVHEFVITRSEETEHISLQILTSVLLSRGLWRHDLSAPGNTGPFVEGSRI